MYTSIVYTTYRILTAVLEGPHDIWLWISNDIAFDAVYFIDDIEALSLSQYTDHSRPIYNYIFNTVRN